jgi:hypothetical protein
VVNGTSELYDKIKPEPRQPLVVEIISALNSKSESGPRQLLVGLSISALYDKRNRGRDSSSLV